MRTVLVALLITAFIGSGVRFIYLDDNVMNMLPKDIDSRRIWDEVVEDFKYTDFLFVAFGNSGENILIPDALALTWDLTEKFEEISHVIGNREGIFISERNSVSLHNTINHIISNFHLIEKKIAQNVLPTKEKFLKQMLNIIEDN